MSKKNKWHDVADDMPQPYVKVLIVTESGNQYIARWTGTNWSIFGIKKGANVVITHWHKLPKKPRPKSMSDNKVQCACPSSASYECWSIRYDIDLGNVAADGGPCQCACHDKQEEEE